MKALIFGVTGQDGSYLSEFLLKKNYEVVGVKRRSSSFNTSRIDHLFNQDECGGSFKAVYGDVTDPVSVFNIINKHKPDEIYNLAAQSHVKVSFEIPLYTASVDALGTLNILEAIRSANLIDKTKFYQASTSELYGKVQETPQTEKTNFYPRSPYGVAKMYAYWITKNYREAYDMYACNGILFNHESPRRGETFVTRKITMGLSKIALGKQERLLMGNLNAKRDWGHAKDFVEMQWLMLQQDKPEDFVIATGQQYSIRQFIEWAAEDIGFKVNFEGIGLDEVGVVSDVLDNSLAIKPGDKVIEIDPSYFRPTEVESLLGDPAKAKEKLNWSPKITTRELCKEMVKNDLAMARKE